MPNQKGFTPIILVLIMVTVIGIIGGGYLVYRKYLNPLYLPKHDNPPINWEAVQNSNPESSSSAETANWKTYTNNKFGFTIQYPENWEIEGDNPIKVDIVISSLDNSSNLIISPIAEARFSTDRNRDKKLANGTLRTVGGRTAKEYKENIEDEFTDVFVRDIQLEDINGLNWTKPNEISYWVDTSQPSLVKIFDQILSTFKFTDQSQTGQVCGGPVLEPCPSGYICKTTTIKSGDSEETSGECIKE